MTLEFYCYNSFPALQCTKSSPSQTSWCPCKQLFWLLLQPHLYFLLHLSLHGNLRPYKKSTFCGPNAT